VAGFQRNQIE